MIFRQSSKKLFLLNPKVIGLITRVVGTLIMIDLAAIAAEAQTKTNQINLITNNLTTIAIRFDL